MEGLIENLRRDPYERATITSNACQDWQLDRTFMLVPAQAYVGQFLETFKTFPPRQKATALVSMRGDWRRPRPLVRRTRGR